MLLHHILTVLKRLGKAADWADDVLVGVHGEWENRDEAEREPVPALLDLCRPVTAVVALACNAFIALEVG